LPSVGNRDKKIFDDDGRNIIKISDG